MYKIVQNKKTLLNDEHYLKIYKNRCGRQLRYYHNNIITNLKTGGFYDYEELSYKECGILQNILKFYIKNYKEVDNCLDTIFNKLNDNYNIKVSRTVTTDGYYYKFKEII